MENTFYNEFDTEQRQPDKRVGSDYRSTFQRDRDGVIYSAAFRRLQAKTQVFLSGQYDFYRTRLTHSIEVAQIGRSICNRLLALGDPLTPKFFIDPDLVEAICLTHDLGHPPFGHAGERTLHRLMREKYGGFEGNAQSLRIIGETIYSTKDSRRGLNPSRAFVDGILKYKRLWQEDTSADNHFLYDEQREWRDFVLPEWGKQSFPDPNQVRSIECQIMDWADDTAYSINDIADSVHAGFLDYVKISQWAEANKQQFLESQHHIDKLLEAITAGVIDAWAGKRVGRFINGCSLSRRNGYPAEYSNRYRYQLERQPDISSESALYKKLAVDLVFSSSKIKQLEFKGDHIIERLFNTLVDVYLSEGPAKYAGLLPTSYHQQLIKESTQAAKARLLCDYLAGMTDGFATRTYKRLFDPEFGSISELT